tara:strand:- start:195 stop:482 length:288 start_codon:yes stop_codon:yes gene_type:complete
MKTNTFNYFRNAFAIVGFFIIACSVGTADEPNVEAEPPVQSNNNGKYQIATMADNYIFVLNTATGKMKAFTKGNGGGIYNFNWRENPDAEYTFTH